MKSNKKILFVLAILTMALVLSCALVACDKAGTDKTGTDIAADYKVTIHPNNGQGDIVWDITKAIPTITKDGYHIAGYFLDAQLTMSTTLESLKATGITKNIDVYVKWKKDVCNHSEGLAYSLNGDGTGYTVTGIGTCTDKELIIPSEYNAKPVTNIGYRAFSGCNGLTSITIPNSVTSIGYSAFSGCNGLTSITIPNSVTSIVKGAFSGCSSLESITIPFVGAKAGVTSSDTYQYQFGYIFGETSYDGGVATPQDSHGIDTYYIPSSLKSVTVTGGNILFGAFYGCSGLTSITIPNSVTSIGYDAFSYCTGLTSITIPDSVTSIDNYAFSYCTGLTSVTIGNSVTSIGYEAFYRCTGLTSITIPNSVTSIDKSAFSGCKGLTSVTIGNGVTSVGEGAFVDCTELTSVTIGNSVTSIGNFAFSGCTGLTSITIPDSVTSIGYIAFSGCTGLTSITFNGTMEQWNAVSKGTNWKINVPATEVVCKDGTVSI